MKARGVPIPLFQNKNTRAVALRREPEFGDTDNPKLPILARRCSQTIYPTGQGQMANPRFRALHCVLSHLL